MAMTYGLLASGDWQDQRGREPARHRRAVLRGYETRDGKHVAVGALEPQFYRRLLALTELDGVECPAQLDRAAGRP